MDAFTIHPGSLQKTRCGDLARWGRGRALRLLNIHELGAAGACVQSQAGGKALCFEHWYIHLLKLSLNLMSPHLLRRMLLSAPAE